MFLDKYRHYVLGLLRIILGYAFVFTWHREILGIPDVHDRWKRFCRTCLVNGRGGRD